MDGNELCIICDLAALPNQKLLNDPERIDTLVDAVKERLSLGQLRSGSIDLRLLDKKLTQRSENHTVFYHNKCPKPLVNRTNIVRTKLQLSEGLFFCII